MNDTPGNDLVFSPALNRTLLRNARKSAREIEALTGIPAAEVAERLSALLDDVNYRDDLIEEKLLMSELSDLVADIRDRLDSALSNEDYVALARAFTQNAKIILDQIEKRRKHVDADLSRVTHAQAKLMAMAINVAMEKSVLDLERMFPGVDPDVVRQVFEKNLPAAIQMLEEQSG